MYSAQRGGPYFSHALFSNYLDTRALSVLLSNAGKNGRNETMSLTQAIALAGGWDKMAALSSARILRADGDQTREQIPANVKKIMENKAPDLQIRPDDILYIPNSLTRVFGARGAEAGISAGTGILVWR
jgi:hypothetical protein